MRVKIGNKYWNLIFTKLDETTGWECYSPDTVNKQIRISNDIPDEEELDIVIHEFLHAADWSKDEEWVEQIAYDLSHILLKLGWKKENRDERKTRKGKKSGC